METLKPLPERGLGVFPHLIMHEPTTLMLKGEALSKNLSVFLTDGRKLLAVKSNPLLGPGFQVIDVATEHELGVIRKAITPNKYHAETSIGLRILDTETGDDCMVLHCTNLADDRQSTQIEFHNEVKKGVQGEVRWKGTTVARIDKENYKMRSRHQLHIAPGMDPFLVVATVVIIMLQRKNKTSPRGEPKPPFSDIFKSRGPKKAHTIGSTRSGGGATASGGGLLAASAASGAGGCSGCGGGGGGGGGGSC